MDNLTHSLAGAALGRAGLYRRTRLAAGALIIGANLPDIDVIGLPFGENLAFRRGITHGPIAMVVLPVLLTGILMLWARWRPASSDGPPLRPTQLLLLSYIAVLSHPLLDWLNSYGVRLLHPFSDRWFYGDTLFIIDPWILMALGAGVWMARRRARANSVNAVRPARAALLTVAGYVALMLGGSALARGHAFEHATTEGERVERVMAAPVPVNPLARSIVIDYPDSYRLGRVVLQPMPSMSSSYEDIPKNARSPAVVRAIATGAFDEFLYWSRFPFYTLDTVGDSVSVRVNDARFPGRGGIVNTFSHSVTVPANR